MRCRRNWKRISLELEKNNFVEKNLIKIPLHKESKA